MANKKISDLTLRSDADATCNFPVDDATQTWRVTLAQVKTFISKLTAVGDLPYGGTAGAGATLTGNTTTTPAVLAQTGTGAASAAPVWRPLKAPTFTKITSGATNYTTPAGVMYLIVKMTGAGGGGAGSSSAGDATTGADGGATTFGTSLLTCPGGAHGKINNDAGGAGGGAPTITSPAVEIESYQGGKGFGGMGATSSVAGKGGAGGGSALFGPGAPGGPGSPSNQVVVANTGGGGDGGSIGANASGNSGSGGGAGACLRAMLQPTAGQVYAYSVGAGGTAGAAGTSGNAGSVGAAGQIVIEEYYQ